MKGDRVRSHTKFAWDLLRNTKRNRLDSRFQAPPIISRRRCFVVEVVVTPE